MTPIQSRVASLVTACAALAALEWAALARMEPHLRSLLEGRGAVAVVGVARAAGETGLRALAGGEWTACARTTRARAASRDPSAPTTHCPWSRLFAKTVRGSAAPRSTPMPAPPAHPGT